MVPVHGQNLLQIHRAFRLAAQQASARCIEDSFVGAIDFPLLPWHTRSLICVRSRNF